MIFVFLSFYDEILMLIPFFSNSNDTQNVNIAQFMKCVKSLKTRFVSVEVSGERPECKRCSAIYVTPFFAGRKLKLCRYFVYKITTKIEEICEILSRRSHNMSCDISSFYCNCKGNSCSIYRAQSLRIIISIRRQFPFTNN